MKSWPLLLYFWAMAQASQAQHSPNEATLNATAISVPDTATHSLESFARYANAHCKTEQEKILSIYKWITTHIKYDTDSMYYYNWAKTTADIAEVTLKRRRGVCENYASLFSELLVKTGIPSWVVNGYTKATSNITKNAHSWSAVQQNKEWWLCDPTWEAGISDGNLWLMQSPDYFLETHMPFDPMWQLRYYPISHKAFKQGRFKDAENTPFFNYPDSIQLFFQQDSLQQLEAFARRMYVADQGSNRLGIWHSYNEMKIAIIYGEKDMDWYNTAVSLLNQATSIFNAFVQYRNNQFIPLKTDADLAKLLQPIAGLLMSAEQQLNQMGKVVENFQYNTSDIKERLKLMTEKVAVQQVFINKYIATDVAVRKKLFLQ